MGVDDCYLLGKLIKTHGLQGELVAYLDVDYPEEYQELESVFVEQNGKLVPFFIESIAVRDNKAFVAFEEIENIDSASPLVGSSLYLPLDHLPPLPEGGYYYHQLIGFKVYEKEKLIGTVTDVYELPVQNLLAVDHQGIEVMIPLENEIIRKVDISAKRIDAQLPDGLIDVYLDTESKSQPPKSK